MSATAERDWLTDDTVAWLRVDGHYLAMTEKEAWNLAWALIGLCVDHRQSTRPTAVPVVGSAEHRPAGRGHGDQA